MKLSNFKLIETKRDGILEEYIATVDVTTGFLWWKKTQKRQIWRYSGLFWCFVDNGGFVPEFQADTLALKWTSKTGQPT